MKKIKIIAVLMMIIFVSGSFTEIKKNLQRTVEIKIISVEYYSINGCSEKAPILVRITFEFNRTDLQNFKMVQKYEGEITKTVDIVAKDKKGNPIYEFCTPTDKNIEFSTFFVGSDGTKTNEIIIKADVQNAKIINGTAPSVISVK